MRTILLALGLVAAGLLAVALLVDWDVTLPPVGPGVEEICADAMQRSTPDLSWVARGREGKVRGREIKAVGFGVLPYHDGDLVRLAGVLHVESWWVALHPSRTALEEESRRAPWLNLESLWPDELFWRTRGPSISDRCAIVEGTFSSGGRFGLFNGTISDVLALEVWSTPHRPFVTTVPPPQPPPR